MNTHVRDNLNHLIDVESDSDTGSAASFTNTSFADLDALTGTPLGSAVTATVDIGPTGLALVSFSGVIDTSSGISLLGFRVSGATTVAASDTTAAWNESANRITVGRTVLVGSLNSGSNTFELQARVTAGTGTLVNVYLAVQPR
jgi:hypothetical protein